MSNALTVVNADLSSLISLPDESAAVALHNRILAWDVIDEAHSRSYAERGLIAIQFEKRSLWKHLIDPDTDTIFSNFTAWMSCSQFLGGRRTNFEAKADVKELVADIPEQKLIGIPKSNLKELKSLSSSVRRREDVQRAAKDLRREQFLDKIEKDYPDQHKEGTRDLRFSPGRSGAQKIEQAIQWAIDHDIAGTRDEALVRMAEEALHEWMLDEELANMPAEAEAQCG